MKPELIKGGDPHLGSPQWFEFLELSTTNSFRYESNTGSFTANKRKDGAWNAYRKRFGKLRQEYLGVSKALDPSRLEEVAAKLALSDTDYWAVKAKAKREVIRKTLTSESQSYKDNRIAELEKELEIALSRIADLDKIVAAAREVVENMVPTKSNMVKGKALVNLKEKILKEIDEL